MAASPFFIAAKRSWRRERRVPEAVLDALTYQGYHWIDATARQSCPPSPPRACYHAILAQSWMLLLCAVFDPANFLETATIRDVRRWRESEITHGRVAMLAALGWVRAAALGTSSPCQSIHVAAAPWGAPWPAA